MIARPSPVPHSLPCVTKSSNSESAISSGMPGPVSRTVIVMVPPDRPAWTLNDSPFPRIACRAFEARLNSTRIIREVSMLTITPLGLDEIEAHLDSFGRHVSPEHRLHVCNKLAECDRLEVQSCRLTRGEVEDLLHH